jgi:ribonuclease P protein component
MTENRFQFPRQARLTRPGEFRTVFRGGRRAQAGALRARLKANGLEHGRLGLAVSRKAAHNAVGRNRVRRQVRESFRLNQGRLAGLDVVVSLYQAPGCSAGDLRPHLPRLWSAVRRAAEAPGKWNG